MTLGKLLSQSFLLHLSNSGVIELPGRVIGRVNLVNTCKLLHATNELKCVKFLERCLHIGKVPR